MKLLCMPYGSFVIYRSTTPMRARAMIWLLWMLPCTLFSQTNISGVVNSYYKVLGIDYATSGLKLDNVSGIAANDRVMIIQMKGASINTSNIGSFGSISSINGAGNYELATVCSVRGDSVFLLQQLLRSYSVADKVQLVRIPKYVSANVTAPLLAAVWDSASGKGGVLAVIVSGTLSLNAPISASASGFKGGIFYKDAGGCASNAFQNYTYNPTPTNYFIYSDVQQGGWKGESVCDLPINLDGGKGACANGGGGGNNHNNAGGGGSNLAPGGKGGDNLSTVGCSGQQAGIGGYALNSNSGTKIFLGGGGGAGHANNTLSSPGGGYGGGIVFIQAQTLVSNGFTISANGADGGNTSGDGASGGGGGGTVILSVANYTDALSIEARGGNGGQEDDETISGRCYGEGGGGSGGVVYFSGLQPAGTINLTGGAKGIKLNSTCASTTGANGNAGAAVINYAYMESTTLSGCGSMVLDANWLYFNINATAKNVLLQWAVAGNTATNFLIERRRESAWLTLTNIPAVAETTEYRFHDRNLLPGTYQYRLKMIDDQRTSYSRILQVIIKNNEPIIIYDAGTQKLFLREADKNDVLQIFDFSGNCVYQKKLVGAITKWSVNTSFLKYGAYIAKTTQGTIKFVVSSQ